MTILVLIYLFFIHVQFPNNRCMGMIESGFDLYCNFESHCNGWRNGTNGLEDSSDWKLAPSLVIDAWHSIPRAIQGEKFAFVVGSGLVDLDRAWLMSDTIPCLPLQSFLTFQYWKNTFLGGIFNRPGVPALSVHLRQPPWSPNLRILADFSSQNRWGWHAAAVEIPASEKPFQIVVSATYQNSFDVLGIDEILFRGYISDDYCNITDSEEVKIISSSGFPESGTTNDTEFSANNLLVQSLVKALPNLQQQLHPQPATPNQLPTASGRHKVPLLATPNQQGVGVGTQTHTLLSVLQSNPRAAAALAPLLQQFLQKSGTGVGAQAWTPIPRTTTTTPPPTTTTTATTVPSIVVLPADLQLSSRDCKGVNCGFEGNSCNYEGTDGNNGAWVIMQGRIGNPVTGISRAAFGKYYAVAYTAKNTSTQILRSDNFTTEEETFLTFWYYFATAESGRMVVCDRSLDNCHWEKTRRSVNSEARRWRRGTILLPSGNHQVLFVVENLMEHHYVGLDQVYLRTHITGPFASCFEENTN